MAWVYAGVAALLAVVWFVWTYNRIVRGRNLVAEGWSGIDVQLKRRHNLIPALVETVKGYAKLEKSILENVASLRAEGLDATDLKTREQGENAVTDGLKRLFAVAEAYPDLKASRSFLDLQEHLADIEDQIQMARRYYNGAVREYNIRIESFPSNIVAGLTRSDRAEFFQVESALEREAPKVEV